MKIFELLSEQTVGTIGSSVGPTSTVGAVSNVPSDKPASATSPTDTANDQNLQKLAATLKQNKVDIHTIAKNMGTRVEMLQEHYVKNLTTREMATRLGG